MPLEDEVEELRSKIHNVSNDYEELRGKIHNVSNDYLDQKEQLLKITNSLDDLKKKVLSLTSDIKEHQKNRITVILEKYAKWIGGPIGVYIIVPFLLFVLSLWQSDNFRNFVLEKANKVIKIDSFIAHKISSPPEDNQQYNEIQSAIANFVKSRGKLFDNVVGLSFPHFEDVNYNIGSENIITMYYYSSPQDELYLWCRFNFKGEYRPEKIRFSVDGEINEDIKNLSYFPVSGDIEHIHIKPFSIGQSYGKGRGVHDIKMIIVPNLNADEEMIKNSSLISKCFVAVIGETNAKQLKQW